MFLSSYENKIDKKGRVSVPASFRSFLTTQGYNGFVSYPSFSNPALECCTQERMETMDSDPLEIIINMICVVIITICYILF